MTLKKFFLLLTIMVIPFCASAQKGKTLKTISFNSLSGYFTKFIDSSMPDMIVSDNDRFKMYVRFYIKNPDDEFYVMLENKSDDISVSIDEKSLKKLISALEALTHNVKHDCAYNPEFMQNEYTTCGCTIGYYVTGKHAEWFMNIATDKKIYSYKVGSPDKLYKTLIDAKDKIDQLDEKYLNNETYSVSDIGEFID